MPGVRLAWLVLIGVTAPAVLFVALTGASLLERPLPERWTAVLAAISMSVATAALVLAFVVFGTAGTGSQLLSYSGWSSRETGVALDFLVDRVSLAFAALATAIAGVVSAFSNRYLHREPGYNRYFVLLSLFVMGMVLLALAGNVTVLFVGWEFVGLSSALLVGFFHERPAEVSNAFRVLSIYRVSDGAMLSAAVLLRHVAGKSALLPFSSWLPRAMEGPTPSSAVYYGSLSIHAGCFLLLRAAPLLEQAPAARFLAGALGAATAIFAGMTTRVQSDVKSSLAYASLTQVGIIVVEIAAGLYTIAFVHLAGHACFRLLQFLSAPNVLHDLHGIESAIGDRPSAARGRLSMMMSRRLQRRLFLIALERGFLDSLLDRVVIAPFLRCAQALTRADQWLCVPLRAPIAGPADAPSARGDDD